MDGVRGLHGWGQALHPVPREAASQRKGAVKGEAFLNHSRVKGNVPSATQNHALNAIVFVYRQMSREGSGRLRGIGRAKEPAGLPVVFTRDEQRAVLARLARGPMRGDGEPLSGSGLRLMEYAGGASGMSNWIKTPSSESGFDYKPPCD